MKYPNQGALWTPKFPKKHEKAPDMGGSISLERELLLSLLENSEEEVTIKLDAWLGKNPDGTRRISLKVNTYQKPVVNQKDPWND
jgi:hypothetical protein